MLPAGRRRAMSSSPKACSATSWISSAACATLWPGRAPASRRAPEMSRRSISACTPSSRATTSRSGGSICSSSFSIARSPTTPRRCSSPRISIAAAPRPSPTFSRRRPSSRPPAPRPRTRASAAHRPSTRSPSSSVARRRISPFPRARKAPSCRCRRSPQASLRSCSSAVRTWRRPSGAWRPRTLRSASRGRPTSRCSPSPAQRARRAPGPRAG